MNYYSLSASNIDLYYWLLITQFGGLSTFTNTQIVLSVVYLGYHFTGFTTQSTRFLKGEGKMNNHLFLGKFDTHIHMALLYTRENWN